MINRDKYLDLLIAKKWKNMIKVITGIRRSGKSVILTQIMDELKDKGIKIIGNIHENPELLEIVK